MDIHHKYIHKYIILNQNFFNIQYSRLFGKIGSNFMILSLNDHFVWNYGYNNIISIVTVEFYCKCIPLKQKSN